MDLHCAKKCIILFLGLTFVMGFLTPAVRAQTPARGNLIGYIYDKDGTTPVPSAVVKLRNINSGAIYEAAATDKAGFFKIENLAKGIYNFGITTNAGDFNSNELVGIIENETTKLSISLSPYENEVRQSMQEIAREQSVKDNEARVGRVVQYLPGTKDAVVFIEKGVLQVDDRIRVRGIQTNFYQNVETMGMDGAKIKRALAGQNPFVRVARDAQVGDGVYLVCKKGVPPFFLTPCGIATVVGGVGALVGIVTVTDKNPVSPIK
jgi:hypothetical protein